MSRVRGSWLAGSVLLAAGFVSSAAAKQPNDAWTRIDPTRVCPVTSVWRLGVGGPRPAAEMIETVVPMEIGGRGVWRVMHTMLRGSEDLRAGTTPGSDVFDLERATLAPLQSEHRLRGPADATVSVVRFEYSTTAGVVLRLNADGSTAERIPLDAPTRVLADGPGAAVLDQAIDWADGLTLRAHALDRFRGRENERLRAIEIAVTGRSAVQIGARRVETFVVSERALDGSFRSVSQVTVARPHRRVHVQFFPAGLREGAPPFVSEVSALMQDASCSG